MFAETITKSEVESAVDRLVEQYRLMCFWSAPKNYFPKSDAARLQALKTIELYGDRAAFVRARELRDWLLLNSKDT